MTKAKFTTGPWHVWADGAELVGDKKCFMPFGGCGCCESPWMNGKTAVEKQANANLIAAAPDLYAALEMIVLSADYHGELGDRERETADAALSKARGEGE